MSKNKSDFTDPKSLRLEAEKKLKNNIFSGDSIIETDMKRLLHELQVHQIELELQNEELQLANERAEASLRKYTILYDFAPMGYFTLDEECVIQELNFTGAEMLRDKRFSLLNTNFKLFIIEESLLTFNEFIIRIFNSKKRETCEVKLGYEGLIFCSVYIEGVVTEYDQKCIISILDTTEFSMHKSVLI